MVNIAYTGIDGKTTSFGVNSPSEAMTRLRSIKGYSGGIVDSAAAGLAKGFAARHKNAARVAQTKSSGTASLQGVTGTNVYSSPFGSASKVTNVTGVRMDEEGNLVTTTQDQYVTSSGNVAAVMPKKDSFLGQVKGSTTEGDVNIEGEIERYFNTNVVNNNVTNNTVINNISKSVVNRIVNNTTIVNNIVNSIINNSTFITQIGSMVAEAIQTKLKFVSMSDSNMKFKTSVSGDEMTVQVGAYYL